MDNRPIGIFDSGVGGLTVVKEVIEQLPNEQIIYFGDTARVPYGSKTKETIIKYSRQIIKFLITKDVKAIIIACGTASSNSLDTMQIEFKNLPVKGVVEPGAMLAVNTTTNNKIGVIATEGTIRSGAYEKIIHQLKHDIEVYSKACPLFVPLAEEGWTEGKITELIVNKYLKDILDKNIDTLILGCTHYPLLIDCIKKVVGEKITLINPAKKTSLELKILLENVDALRTIKMSPQHEFYVSDNTTIFNKLSLSIFKKQHTVMKIDIDKY